MKLHDWLNKQDRAYYGLCSPPMNAQLAVNFLISYLLGEDWYCVNSQNNEQVNTEAVFEILYKHSKRFRRECRIAKKQTKEDVQ